MKNIKKILSLALVLCMIASMLVFTSVTSFAFGVNVSTTSITVDKAQSNTCSITASLNTDDEGNDIYREVVTYTEWLSPSVTSPATCSGSNGSYTVNVSSVSVGSSVTFNANARFWGYGVDYRGQHTDLSYKDRSSSNVTIYVTCSHTNRWDSGTVTTDPTCTVAGVKTYTCSVCGGTKTEPVAALGHDFTVQDTSATYLRTAATCTAASTYFYKCSRCDEKGTEYYSYGEALGHLEYSQIDVAPTPNSTGIRGYYCSRCNERIREEIIPILTGIDVTIYYARQVISENDNNQLLSSKTGFETAYANFINAYNSALQYEGVTVTQDNEAAIDAADEALYEQVLNMRNYETLDTAVLQTAIALTPQYDKQYYETNSYSVWSGLRTSAQTFVTQAQANEKTRADAPEMLTLTDALESAYNNLAVKLADFTNLNNALALPQVVNKDLYKDDVRLPLEALLAQVDFTKTIFEQSDVDTLAANIVEAASYLTTETLDYADYTEVDNAIAAAEALTPSNYTNFDAVQTAINAVDRTILKGEQDLVDEMALAINRALENLIPAPADYTVVNNAIAAAQATDPAEMYINYYKVQNLIDSIDWNKDIFHQSEVDAMAQAIMTAIGELQYKQADYTNVLAALDRTDTLGSLDDYTEESLDALEEAIEAIDYTVTIERQSQVEAMAQTLEDAIDAMELKGANYAQLEEAYEIASNLDEENYSNYSEVSSVINSIVWDKNIRQQADVDAYTQALYNAMRQLQPVGADYTAVDNAIATVQAMIDTSEYEYDEDSLAQYYAFLETIDRTLDIFDQDTVDAYAQQILDAGEAIEYVEADYSLVASAIQQARGLNTQNYVDFTAVEEAISAVEYGIKIDRQTDVDAMAQAILDAIDALELVGADYSYVDALIEEFNGINTSYYEAEDISAVATVIENTVVRGYKIDRQTDVDAMAQTIYRALRDLETKMLLADTTALNAAIGTAMGRINEMQETGYDIVPEQLTNLYDLIDEAESLDGSYIDVQGRIDTLTQTILEAAQSLEFVFTITDETTAIIDGEYVYGFAEGITAEEIESMFSYVGTANVQVEETNKGLGTGSQVIFTNENGEELDRFTVIIFGDADGDGWIDMFDVSITSEIANYGIEGNEELIKAADVNLDGFVDSYDVAIIIAIANMEVGISQDGICTVA